jgi:hypothetical protein
VLRIVASPPPPKEPEMIHPNLYAIRRATDADGEAVRRVAALDSQRPVTGQVLVGEIDGAIAAAISIDDGRVVADPFVPTASLVALLRQRAAGAVAVRREPSLRHRIRAALVPAAA